MGRDKEYKPYGLGDGGYDSARNKQIVSSGRVAQRSLQQVGQQQVEPQQVAV